MENNGLLFVGRHAELEKVSRFFALSPVFAISGLKGMGKSALARRWLDERALRASWIYASPFQTLAQILGVKADTPEIALEEWVRGREPASCHIWEDFHRLPASVQKMVLGFLESDRGSRHLILSDEKISCGAPQLELSPFGIEDIREFLRELNVTEQEAEPILRETGGIPLLVILRLQSRLPADPSQTILDGMAPEERALLGILSIRPGGFSLNSLAQISGQSLESANARMESLFKHNLVEKMESRQEGSLYRLPPFLHGLLENLGPGSESQNWIRQALALIQNPFERLVLSSRAGEMEVARLAVDELDPRAIEMLGSADLDSVGSALETVFQGNEEASTAFSTSGYRLLSKAKFLRGKRIDALRLGERYFSVLSPSRLEDAVNQEFLLEYLQLLNRNDRSSEVVKWEKVVPVSAGPTRELFQLEILIAKQRLEKGTAQAAAQAFDGIVRRAHTGLLKLSNESSSKSGERERAHLENGWRTALAFAVFQKARALDGGGELLEARTQYEVSIELLRQLRLPYFEAVATLNRSWILAKQAEWAELEPALASMRSTARKFGYDYVSSGVDLLEAFCERLQGRFTKALDLVETALGRMGPAAPTLARLDACMEKCRILFVSGQRIEARRCFEESLARLEPKDQESYAARFRGMAAYLESPASSGEEFVRWVAGESSGVDENSRISLRCQGLSRGLLAADDTHSRRLGGFPLGKVHLAEARLLEAIRASGSEGWGIGTKGAALLAELERALAALPESVPEGTLLLLLQANSSSEPPMRQAFLERAKWMVLRSSWDEEIKEVFRLWIEAAESGEAFPWEDSRWKRLPAGDREQWGVWLRAYFPRGNAKRWELIIDGTRTELNARLDPIGLLGNESLLLLADEEMGDVYFRGKSIRPFQSQSILRRLLVSLVEAGTAGLAKEILASQVWGEKYQPQLHDARLYVTVQRIRKILKKADVIQSTGGGYRWNPRFRAGVYRALSSSDGHDGNRSRRLILRSVEGLRAQGREWISRRELAESTGVPDSSLKRHLAQLVTEGVLHRQGAGRQLRYELPRP